MSVNAIETTSEDGLDLGLLERLHRPWWNSTWDEFGAAFKPAKEFPPLPQYRDAVEGEADFQGLILDDLRVSWYKSIPAQLRELSEDRKRPPAKLSFEPVPVKSIWGTYDNRNRAFPMTVFIHIVVVMLIFSIRSGPAAMLNSGSVTLIVPVDISPYLAKLLADGGKSGGGGGGGNQSPLPPTRGKLPRFKLEQITPPTPVIRNPEPELAVEPSVVVPPEMQQKQLDMAMFGDPLGRVGPPSAGPGVGGGIGRGRGGGVGSGKGAGVGPGSGGGIGGGVYRVGGGVSAPRLTRKVEPEYSEEARKAKYQGTVVLAVEVWPDGRAHNIRVIRSLGLGLDEKAIEAVQQWQFVPGKKDSKAVKVQASIEVNFRLL